VAYLVSKIKFTSGAFGFIDLEPLEDIISIDSIANNQIPKELYYGIIIAKGDQLSFHYPTTYDYPLKFID
jgi:hypothetical protein